MLSILSRFLSGFDWSMQMRLVIFVVLSLVRISWLSKPKCVPLVMTKCCICVHRPTDWLYCCRSLKLTWITKNWKMSQNNGHEPFGVGKEIQDFWRLSVFSKLIYTCIFYQVWWVPGSWPSLVSGTGILLSTSKGIVRICLVWRSSRIKAGKQFRSRQIKGIGWNTSNSLKIYFWQSGTQNKGLPKWWLKRSIMFIREKYYV